MSQNEVAERAASRFKEDYSCSEAVLAAFAEYLQIDSEIIPRIASGFGGGIGRSGSLCGDLTGAIMSLGLKYGRDKPGEAEAHELCVKKSFECYKRFENKMGSVFCYDLTECDLTTAEGKKKLREMNIRENRCSRYVRDSVGILFSLLDNTP